MEHLICSAEVTHTLMSKLCVEHSLNKNLAKVIEIGAIQKLRYVSYSLFIVTMAVSVAVCEIFSVKEWYDLENMVRVRSRSLEMAPFDRSHTSSY